MTQFDGKPVRIIDRKTQYVLCIDEPPSFAAFEAWRERTKIDATEFSTEEWPEHIDVFVTVRP